jgi:DNA-binding Lrp family transcriptional regulator
MLDASPEGVGKAVRRLEKDGLIVAIARGRTRVLQLNVRWFASRELRALLDKMIEFEPRLASAAEVVRKRPRRSGKPL